MPNNTAGSYQAEATLSRTAMLIGGDAMDRLSQIRVIIFGVGGVGSWCAEALVRTGVTNLTMVDPDLVVPSNINRQLPATSQTVGQAKVEVLRSRLLEINPQAHIVAEQRKYCQQTASDYNFDQFDYVIDAIDSLTDKSLLIRQACLSTAQIFSSMGAALKSDPQRISVAEFWHVKGCPLARALRQKFKREGTFPARKFKCVYSDELLKNRIDVAPDPESPRANGTLMHITATFGLTLASLVIRHAAPELGK